MNPELDFTSYDPSSILSEQNEAWRTWLEMPTTYTISLNAEDTFLIETSKSLGTAQLKAWVPKIWRFQLERELVPCSIIFIQYIHPCSSIFGTSILYPPLTSHPSSLPASHIFPWPSCYCPRKPSTWSRNSGTLRGHLDTSTGDTSQVNGCQIEIYDVLIMDTTVRLKK